jgi:hypothetical protein
MNKSVVSLAIALAAAFAGAGVSQAGHPSTVVRVDSRAHALGCSNVGVEVPNLTRGNYIARILHGSPGIVYEQDQSPQFSAFFIYRDPTGSFRYGALNGTRPEPFRILRDGGFVIFALVSNECSDNSGYLDVEVTRLGPTRGRHEREHDDD